MVAKVDKIIEHYSNSENPGVISNLYRLLSHGKLGGTGNLVILPVDQGFEHGPIKSFGLNPDAYDPNYHPLLAIESGISAYVSNLGMITCVANWASYRIPLILKLNGAISLNPSISFPDQAYTATVSDALKLGCVGVGITIYPGSPKFNDSIEKAKVVISEARNAGLVVIVWSYPRGPELSKAEESSLETVTYAAYIASSIGAHIIKVKLPVKELSNFPHSTEHNIVNTLESRIANVVRANFNAKRLVVFSGGETKNISLLYEEVRAIRDGGGNGSIIGRNTFQRPKNEAMQMLRDVMEIYKGKDGR